MFQTLCAIACVFALPIGVAGKPGSVVRAVAKAQGSVNPSQGLEVSISAEGVPDVASKPIAETPKRKGVVRRVVASASGLDDDTSAMGGRTVEGVKIAEEERPVVRRVHANDETHEGFIHGVGGEGAAEDDKALVNDLRKSWEVNASLLADLVNLPPFPRKIHVVWPDRRVVNSSSEMVIHGLRRMIDLNPGWEGVVHEYADIDARLQNSSSHSADDRKLLSVAHIVERTDAFRLLVLYEEGGFYQDMDRVYNVPMSELLEPGTRYLLPTYLNINFAQDIFGTAPGNPIIKALIKAQSDVRLRGGPNATPLERKNGWVRADDVMKMGPAIYSKVISDMLFGRNLEKGLDLVAARRAIRKAWPVMVTKKEMWCDGLVVRPYTGCKSVSRGGLYDEYHMKAWGPTVRKLWATTGAASKP